MTEFTERNLRKKRVHAVRGLVVVGIGAALLLGGGLPAAHAAEPDPNSDPKSGVARDSLPLDLTGDALHSERRDKLATSLAPLAGHRGDTLWDPTNRTLTVQMTSDSAIKQAQAIASKSATGLQVKFERVEYTAKELNELSDRLLGNQLEWAGASGIGGGYDPKTNRVVMQVDRAYKDAPKLIAAIQKLNDPRITLEFIEALKDWKPENRVDDVAPWSAGGKITSGTTGCTLGWAWKMWGTNNVVSSTARHCAKLPWYNNGTYVGTVFQSAPAADSAFMDGGSYNATVFVGSATTSVTRAVVAVDGAWSVGDSVAMSGATTGLNVSTVQVPTYTLPSCAGEYAGLTGVLMASHITAAGDSGGPWLTTESGTGYVVAHGQHFGRGCAVGQTGSFFIKLNTISAQQGASLLLL